MQFILTQEEYNKLRNSVSKEKSEPEHSSVFAADLVQMLHKSRTEIFRSSEHLGAEALNLQVKLDDIPIQLRRLIERHVRN